MLVEFKRTSGSSVWINPDYVVNVTESNGDTEPSVKIQTVNDGFYVFGRPDVINERLFPQVQVVYTGVQ